MTIVVGIDTDAGQGGVVAHERASLRKIDQKLRSGSIWRGTQVVCEEENPGSNTMLGICNLYSHVDIDYRSTCVPQYAESPLYNGKNTKGTQL